MRQPIPCAFPPNKHTNREPGVSGFRAAGECGGRHRTYVGEVSGPVGRLSVRGSRTRSDKKGVHLRAFLTHSTVVNGRYPMRKRKLPIVLSALMLMTAMLTTPVSADINGTTLPNGAALSVSIDDPVTCTEFLLPPLESTMDVDVTGTASVGLGEPDATFVYVIDGSGSTSIGSGTGCSPILGCEKQFINALNADVVANGSADEAGVVVFGAGAVTADMEPATGDQLITAPDADSYVSTVVTSATSSGGVVQFTSKSSGGGSTNFAAGLAAATTVVNASSNGTNIVVFLSDGGSNTGGSSFGAALATLASTGAVVHAYAIGTGNTCNSGSAGTLQQIATATGGTCTPVPDPGNLPDIIPDLIGSTLESLEIDVDGEGASPIPNSGITPDLPEPGAVEVDYTTTATGLAPEDHSICVTANGSDSSGGTASVTQCETIHVLQLALAPLAIVNELGVDNEHAVTATILGDVDYVANNPRTVTFEVMGANPVGPTGSQTVNGVAEFTYTVPVESDSLGTDTIRAMTVIAGETTFVDVIKEWVDTTPPEAACLESTNPSGKIPPAPANGGQAQNPDGFYELSAEDDVWADAALEVFVVDTGSGTVFGPFDVGTIIKYTEDQFAVPEMKKIGSDKGKADAVTWHIIGNGDAALYAVDGSGNQSSNAMCLVPPPPK